MRAGRPSAFIPAVLAATLMACGADEDPAGSSGDYASADRPATVQIGQTGIVGRRLASSNVAEYLGIPFAAAPVGPRRWAPPAPIELRDRIEATRYAPACMQGPHIVDWYGDLMEDFGADRSGFPVPGFSEDCLYLNVWTPASAASAALPVLVWIHGGSLRGGWSYEPNYRGDRLAARGAVVVSIAYRLDVFGFFSHPALPQSNFGLLDQIAALSWVAQHIEAFGGDPGNVTVFGESAGAASAGYLLHAPQAEGLFQRVIHQSAGYQYVTDDRREDFLDSGRELAAAVTGNADDLVALRRAPASEILAAAGEVFADDPPGVVIDNDTLGDDPAALLAAGRLHAVDLIAGSNVDEWKMYLDADTSAADVSAWLDEHGLDGAAVRDEIGGDDARRQLDRLETAYQFVCPSLALADAVNERGGHAFVYHFSRVRDADRARDIGAYHGAEIPYLFDTHDDWLPTAAADRRLAEAMASYWLQFAAAGDPNGDPHSNDLATWPAWSRESEAAMNFGERPEARVHPEADLCRALAEARSEAAP